MRSHRNGVEDKDGLSDGLLLCRLSAQSTEEELKYDVILMSLGSRYQMYCSNLSRTYLVDPNKTQEAQYKALLEAQTAAINALKPGKPMSDAFNAAIATLKVLSFPLSVTINPGLTANNHSTFRTQYMAQ